jgi:hypothetical protein
LQKTGVATEPNAERHVAINDRARSTI